MKNPPAQLQVASAMEATASIIVAAIDSAWSRFEGLAESGFRIDCRRTRANVVWEWITQEMHQRLAGNAVQPLVKNGQTELYRANEWLHFRIKKGDPDGYTCSYPTQSALEFYDQQAMLDGIDKVWNVDVVYILTSSEQKIADIRVVFRLRSRIEWQFSLPRQQPSSNVVALPSTTPNNPPPQTTYSLKKEFADEQSAAEPGRDATGG